MSDQPAENVPSKQVRVVTDNSYLFDTARFEHMYRIATAMAHAALIPDHLVGKKVKGVWTDYTFDQIVGNCFLIVNQAARWDMDPFAVMAETYEVGNKLAFQGKLVAAVVNSRARLVENLSYTFQGTGDARTVTVHGRIQGEAAERTVDLALRDARTGNDMWSKDPDQKLIYSAALKWARRHTPEIILGVYSDDDADRIAESMAAKHGFPPEVQPRTIEGLTAKLTQQTVANPIPQTTRQAAPDITPEMATIAKQNAAKQATKRDEQPPEREPGDEADASTGNPNPPHSIATDIANTLAMLVETGEADKINRARKIFDAATGPEATLDDEGIDLVRGVWKQLQAKITETTSKKK